MTITFMIAGNHTDRDGNPVPYTRSTREALWRSDGKRYAAWKEYVQQIFNVEFSNHCISNPDDRHTTKHWGDMLRRGNLKPIELRYEQTARMDINIWWANCKHGDPDNIWKGIADALFVQDKHLNGSFESDHHSEGKGRVEVKIKIE